MQELIFSPSSPYDQDHVKPVFQEDSPPSYTLEAKGSKHVVITDTGKDKERYTVILTISMTGRKLNTIIILKAKGVKKAQ